MIKDRLLTEGRRIYAIGDIHGMLQPLERLHRLIDLEEKKRGPVPYTRIVYLGDYIDRGKDSKRVVDFILAQEEKKHQSIFLKGNHEYAMLQFLADPERSAAWLNWGGMETITSYGIDPFDIITRTGSVSGLADPLAKAIPPEHMQFYQNLKTSHEEEGYIFVHAGLFPGVPLDQQNERDLLTIREAFINSNYNFGKKIIFGHTIFNKPYQQNGKIGIDTGAYRTGRLTCAVLENNDAVFLTT